MNGHRPADDHPAPPPLCCLQAALARMMTRFLTVQDVSTACAVHRLLDALVDHPELERHTALVASYRHLLEVWGALAHRLHAANGGCNQPTRLPSARVH